MGRQADGTRLAVFGIAMTMLFLAIAPSGDDARSASEAKVDHAVARPPTRPDIASLLDFELNASWGYAVGRNAARWALIRQSLIQSPPLSILREQNKEDGGSHGTLFEVVDFGADQGYFTLSTSLLLSALLRYYGRDGYYIRALAVEKGGFGGSFWKAQEMKARSVHDIFTSMAHSMSVDAAVRFSLCPTVVNALTFHRDMSRAHCQPTVQLLLSMLHWVDGVDGEAGLLRAICNLAKNAEVTFVELPHPAARKTFGVRRYAEWYRREVNVTKLLQKAVHPANCEARCATVDVVGRTPWGKGLFREIHRITNKCRPQIGGKAPSSGCIALFKCRSI
jgi:hypothetical protein